MDTTLSRSSSLSVIRWAERYIKQKFGKDAKFDILYIYTGSFNDPAKGKQAAEGSGEAV